VDAMHWQVSASFAFAMVGGYIIGPYAPGAQALQQLIHSLTASAPDVTVSAGGRGPPRGGPPPNGGGAGRQWPASSFPPATRPATSSHSWTGSPRHSGPPPSRSVSWTTATT